MTTTPVKSATLQAANTDTYTWTNQYGGTWGTVSDWQDTTLNAAATVAPGATNAVSIVGGASTNILGNGAAAQLSVGGSVVLWGTVAVGGAVQLAQSGAGELDLDGSASVTSASLNLATGTTLEVADGSAFKVTGSATLSDAFLMAASGSMVQLGSLVANAYQQPGSFAGLQYGAIAVDDGASIEVGTTGGAALGAITIDKGQTAAVAGSLDGNLVLNGTLAVQAGDWLAIDVNDPFGSPQSISGAGTLVIGENSQLTLGVANSAAVMFSGPGGTLVLNASGSGTINGFGASDTIELTGPATGLSYTQTSASIATLTLTKGGKAAGTLTLAGNYTGNLFHIRFDTMGNAYITEQVVGSAPVQPTLILGTAGNDTLTATANNQTLTGGGGNDILNAGTFTSVVFKDTSADLNGSTISFSASDVIDIIDMKAGSASFAYTPASGQAYYSMGYTPATLVVTDGTHVATISFASSSAVLPSGYWSISSDGGTGALVKYTALNTDAYTFVPSVGGSFSVASNWRDTSTATAATLAPSYGNAVTVAGGGNYTDVSGTGVAASVTTSGDVLQTGTLTIGSTVTGVSGALTQTGTLALDAAANLKLYGSAAIGGALRVGGGSKLTSAIGATFTGSSASLMAIDASAMQFASITTTPTFNTTTDQTVNAYSPASISVDGNSTIELGTAGNAQTGALTIDSGVTADLNGAIDGSVVVNGSLVANGVSLAINPFGTTPASITGTGTLVINQGTLALSEADSAAILFSQAGFGTLTLSGALPTGKITGFAKGSTINVAKQITSVGYSQGPNGTGVLTLLNGSTTVGTLSFAGTYSAQQFQVQCSATGGSSTITYAATPSTVSGSQVSSSTDGYSWTSTGGGVWSYASNWTDTTTNQTPLTAPGAADAVSIFSGGPAGPQMISGSGSAASLSLSGGANVIFTGNIAVGGALSSIGASNIALESGARFSVGGLQDYSAVQIAGGSTLTVNGVSGGTTLSGTLNVVGGSVVQTMGSFNIGGTIGVDATSSMEYGSAGGAAAGALTIDNGLEGMLLQSGVLATKLVVNGILDVNTGTIEGFGGTAGSITGSGKIQIGTNPGAQSLTLNASDSAAIAFYQANPGTPMDSLIIMGPLPTGSISGFVAGDTIQIDQTVTGVSVRQSGTQDVLTLTNGAATVGTLTLLGSYASNLFQLDVAAATGFGTISLVNTATSSVVGTANVGTDPFNWIGGVSGSWTTAADWVDTKGAAAPNTVPGSNNAVTITGPAAISGNGAAASLTIGNKVILSGSVTVGTQVVIGSTVQPGSLALNSAARLTAASATVTGSLEFSGGSSAIISGNAVLKSGSLIALNGSTVQLGGLLGSGTGNVIAIDGNSMVKIGTSAPAAYGTLTQAVGSTMALTGSIYGNVAANGTLAVAGGGALFIDMTGTVASDPYASSATIGGTGTLSITEGSTLGLGAVDTALIQFAGPNADLTLAAIPTGTIMGFAIGDQIQVDQAVTGVSYRQVTTTTGTLTLTNGATTVGTLKLAGSYGSGNMFHIDPSATGSTAVITLQSLGVAAIQPTLIQGTAASDVLTATANSQTLTGLGGGDTLNGAGFTVVDFKDLTANLNGSTIQGFTASDFLDFTDMTAASATVRYTNGTLSVTDGTHAATLALGFTTMPASGSFLVASDGSTGTKVYW